MERAKTNATLTERNREKSEEQGSSLERKPKKKLRKQEY
jgi:hypothetical protein